MNDLAAADSRPPIVVLRDRLEQRRGELTAALVDIPADQFIRAVITSATINPEIQACSWPSVWLACMRACRDGLLPDGIQGAIVPFKNNAQWIPMYQGLVSRFRRSGNFRWIGAAVVREGEDWTHYTDETGEHFRHVPGDDITRPILRIYAAATTLDGGMFVAVLPKAEADKIKNMSRTMREDAPWKMWESEMYKKTALRRLAKLLPSARDILGDDEFEPPETSPPARIESNRPTGAAAALDAFVGQSPPTSQQTPPPVGGEEGGGAPAVETEGPPHGQSAETESAAADPIAAYERGKRDKAKGVAQRALPGEYRGSDVTALAAAWLKGWQGSPL
jgi:recombination protein RecT